MKINKMIIIRIIFIIWAILWINFILRDLFKKKYLKDYMILIGRNEDSRRSYVYGDSFYEFLKFSKNKLSPQSTYRLIGVKDYSIEYRRAVYYLYPIIESDKADYILVFNKNGYKERGYLRFAALDDSRFILKKIKNE